VQLLLRRHTPLKSEVSGQPTPCPIFPPEDRTVYTHGPDLRGDADRPASRLCPAERDALDATVAMATNDDEFCRNYGAKPGNEELRGLSPEPLESARGHNPNA
jgi:hypothetical protein